MTASSQGKPRTHPSYPSFISGSQKSDTALLRRVVAGDDKARERLFNFLLPVLQVCAQRQWQMSIQDQQDLVGQISFWLVKEIGPLCQRYDPIRGSARAYFRTIIYRYASRYRQLKGAKTRSQEMLSTRPLEASDEASDLEARLEGMDLEEAILVHVNGQKPADQFIFFEYVVGERSARDVAEALGVTVVMVHKRAERLKTRLETSLKRAGLLVAVLFFLTRLFVDQ